MINGNDARLSEAAQGSMIAGNKMEKKKKNQSQQPKYLIPTYAPSAFSSGGNNNSSGGTAVVQYYYQPTATSSYNLYYYGGQGNQKNNPTPAAPPTTATTNHNDISDRQTTNFRFLRHHYYQPQDHQSYHINEMNSHSQSELLSANNNNSRQQLNNSSLSYTTPTTSPYNDLHLVASEMNAIYENTRPFDQVREFHPTPLQDQEHIDEPRYPSPPPIGNHPYMQQHQIQQDHQQPAQTQQQQGNITPDSREDGQQDNKSDSDPASPGRPKPILKPERPVTKTAGGQYECNWPNCAEEIKTFARKCEWSKHMDKHDRPYKCLAAGCEKLPGFTYSGGLLRHEREVHNKHGGPRKQLNCPHINCKRHGGKGFSRQENLNEHLRRVHTTTPVNGNPTNGTDLENGGGPDQQVQDQDIEAQIGAQLGQQMGQVQGQGQKRKRLHQNDDGDDVREEIKRLRQENHDLREELERTRSQQEAIQADMQRQLHHLQAVMQLQPRMQQAPPANMV